jgi:hypothetical protein
MPPSMPTCPNDRPRVLHRLKDGTTGQHDYGNGDVPTAVRHGLGASDFSKSRRRSELLDGIKRALERSQDSNKRTLGGRSANHM